MAMAAMDQTANFNEHKFGWKLVLAAMALAFVLGMVVNNGYATHYVTAGQREYFVKTYCPKEVKKAVRAQVRRDNE